MDAMSSFGAVPVDLEKYAPCAATANHLLCSALFCSVLCADRACGYGAFVWCRGHIDYLVSSSNKCIEGVPGFSFILARNSALDASKGNADTVSLDIHKQAYGHPFSPSPSPASLRARASPSPLIGCSLCLAFAGGSDGFKKNAQFRFTPPTHAMMAFGYATATCLCLSVSVCVCVLSVSQK